MFSVYCTWYKSLSSTCAVSRRISIIYDYEIGRTQSDFCVLYFILSCIGDETSSKNVQANRLFHLEIWGEHKVSFIVSRPDNSVFPSQEVFEAKQAGKRTKHKQTKTPASKTTETEARRCEALNAVRSPACYRRRRRARQWNGAAVAALANPHGIKFIYVHSVLFKNLTLWWWHGTLNFQPYQYHSHIWITTTCYALDIPYTLDIHISRIYIVTLFFLLSSGVAFLARAQLFLSQLKPFISLPSSTSSSCTADWILRKKGQ